jgi:predicted Rossmann-fold nucleotide-binding protein
MTWAQLGRHQKPILLANVLGFWDALIALLDHMRAARFIRSGMDVPYLVAENVEEVVPKLMRAVVERPQPVRDQGAVLLSRM